LRAQAQVLNHDLLIALVAAFAEPKTEHQAVKDELARLKSLPPWPPQKPSGMGKATDRSVSGGGGDKNPEAKKSSRRRGSQPDKLTIGATVIVGAKVPPGSRTAELLILCP
jgi:hypothetical protein